MPESWLLKDLLRRFGPTPPRAYPEHYPRDLVQRGRTRDGRRYRIRPVRPDDAERLRAGFATLSPETVYRRFHYALNALSDDALRYLTHLDYQQHLALIALDEGGGTVGVARYYLPEDAEFAEAAVVVGDAWQGQGVGSALLKLLAQAAETRGIAGFEGYVQRDNLLMRRMVERSGYRLHEDPVDDATLRVWFRFDDWV
ncbi:MAG: GNAT family N-acetyltransferase [Planctomycetota bacterium]